jgi:predicted enzyme related to lactoylglutathione lyase
MIQINEIAFIGYPVTNVPRARAFYEDALRLKPTKVFEQEGHFWIEYDVGASTLAISDMTPDWKPGTGGPSVAFEVADFDEAIRHLEMHQVMFQLRPADTGVCNLAVIADPDGNSITIHKRKAHAG